MWEFIRGVWCGRPAELGGFDDVLAGIIAEGILPNLNLSGIARGAQVGLQAEAFDELITRLGAGEFRAEGGEGFSRRAEALVV